MTETPADVFRPTTFDGFVGQAKLKERLTVQIEAALIDVAPLAHVFLTGPPGFGKTTLAHLIADKLGDRFTGIQCPVNEKTLIRTCRAFEGGILFLDEIHNLAKKQQETLLPVLSDSTVSDRNGRSYEIPFLTVVAATTERDKVIAPLHDRFPIAPEFEPYTDDEMVQIIQNMARNAHVRLDTPTAQALGRAAGGVPRAAEALVKAARGLSVTGREATPEAILWLCGRDADGLTDLHVRYLEILRAQGNTAGQKTIEMLLREPALVIRDLERLLLERNYIEYLPTGRELTAAGEKKLRGGEDRPYRRTG